MRLDKYLKVSRVVKRRTVAQALCVGGHVKKNGRTAKPAAQVEVGDSIQINFGARVVLLKVTQLRERADKRTADEMYEIVQESRADCQT